jgi:acetamidase/formamidase
MAEQRFHPTRHFNAIGVAEPCLRVADGDTVVTDTIDASALDAREVTVANRPNPMTGPFYIESAEPGDTLAVRIDRLDLSRFCAAPLITYCAVKEINHGHSQDGLNRPGFVGGSHFQIGWSRYEQDDEQVFP